MRHILLRCSGETPCWVTAEAEAIIESKSNCPIRDAQFCTLTPSPYFYMLSSDAIIGLLLVVYVDPIDVMKEPMSDLALRAADRECGSRVFDMERRTDPTS